MRVRAGAEATEESMVHADRDHGDGPVVRTPRAVRPLRPQWQEEFDMRVDGDALSEIECDSSDSSVASSLNSSDSSGEQSGEE